MKKQDLLLLTFASLALVCFTNANSATPMYSHFSQLTTSTSCQGRTPTIVGTNNADSLTGTSGNDVIDGRGGNDIINGLGGNDTICGGDGDDTISGGAGNDGLSGGTGNDSISGGANDDSIDGNVSFYSDFEKFVKGYVSKLNKNDENFKIFKKELNTLSNKIYSECHGSERQYLINFMPSFYILVEKYNLD